ncbi:hypothetical protein [Actinoplanes sp. L3-i22]|uniref:hypothetical protein n=1 Tax=Actinoplanes sp. L3-i22 TaxID=2836373 RepID=UPI001C748D6A|nr:hypothetical protein [Actinoplanes sp. L3-i22]BCY11779.1 hypothetical protein L3i22_068670 [Actinoplanes sp. L3-i22]
MTTRLTEAIVSLAETPDDVPDIDQRLRHLAQLAADRVAAVDYAAVTMRPDDDRCFVAASGELIGEIEGGVAAAAGADDATMTWPGFRDTAARMGLGAVSIPLFTGSGAAVATLDLYGHDPAAMAPLSADLCAVYDPDLRWPGDDDSLQPLDAGGEELVAGFLQALSVRETIQFALVLIAASDRVETDAAYLRLRLRAAEQGVSLPEAAGTVITARFRA